MIGLDCPGHLIKLHSLKLTHFHFVGRPVFNVAVWGDQLEYLDEPISFQMLDGARLADFHFADAAQQRDRLGFDLPQTLRGLFGV